MLGSRHADETFNTSTVDERGGIITVIEAVVVRDQIAECLTGIGRRAKRRSILLNSTRNGEGAKHHTDSERLRTAHVDGDVQATIYIEV